MDRLGIVKAETQRIVGTKTRANKLQAHLPHNQSIPLLEYLTNSVLILNAAMRIEHLSSAKNLSRAKKPPLPYSNDGKGQP